jgi:hypothetical protein
VGRVGAGSGVGSVGETTGTLGVGTGSVGSGPDTVGEGVAPVGVGLGDRVGRLAWSREASRVISGESGARACGLSAR